MKGKGLMTPGNDRDPRSDSQTESGAVWDQSGSLGLPLVVLRSRPGLIGSP